MANVNEEKVVADVEYKEETMNEEFKDVTGVQDESDKKDLPAVKTKKVTKRDVIVFGLGAVAGAAITAGAAILYAKFGVGDPGQVAEKVAEVAPEVVGA